jgi:hypothetical protein
MPDTSRGTKPEAKSLLGFTFAPASFIQQGAKIIAPDTERKIAHRSHQLSKIAQKHRSYQGGEPPDIGAIYRRFMHLASNAPDLLPEVFSTRRMVRKLAWTLNYAEEGQPSIVQSPHLQKALKLISAYPTASVILGLYEALLKSWLVLDGAKQLRSSLKNMLVTYKGHRQTLKKLAEHSEYFLRADGGFKLGAALAASNPPRPLSGLLEVLVLPGHVQRYAFFTNVVTAYIQVLMRRDDYADCLQDTLDFLEKHNQSFAFKYGLSRIILKVAQRASDKCRDLVQDYAFKHIGDPSQDHKWQPWTNASDADKKKLKEAQETLNTWIVQRFIAVFFNKVAMDRDRRDFWMNYARHITRFKVLSDPGTRYKLQADERLRPYIKSRFGRLQDSNGLSALMMQIKDRLVVEFSHNGNACYVYKTESEKCPRFSRQHYIISDLKYPNMNLLFRSSGYYIYSECEEGRLLHYDGWEDRLSTWFTRHLGL